MKKLTATLLSIVLMFSLLFVDGAFTLNVFGASYYGLFYDEQSDGGFEYNGWTQNSVSSASNVTWSIDSAEHNRGSKSAKFAFKTKPTNTTISIKMDIPAANVTEIDFLEDYCWTSYIKCDSNFWGTVSLKLVDKGAYNSTGLKNKNNKDTVEVFNIKTTQTNWTRFDSGEGNHSYAASTLESFLNGKSQGLSVVLTVSARKGTIWIDDLDFKAVSALGDNEEVEREDNTGTQKGTYKGLFDDRTSDGGFEFKAWKRADQASANFAFNPYVNYNGLRSAEFNFTGAAQETVVVYNTFADIAEINPTQTHAFLAAVKANSEFDGTVGLKIAAPNKQTESGILNNAASDVCIVYDSAKDDATTGWKAYNTADDYYYSGAVLSELLMNNSDVTSAGSITIVLTVTATKGKVWVDDIDLKQRNHILGDDDSLAAGAYTGLFDSKDKNNGGFEYGIWDKVASETTATGNSKAIIATDIVNSGNRAIMMNFANNVLETQAFKASFTDLDELNTAADHYFKGFVKVAGGFDGTVSLKITAKDDLNTILHAKDNSSEIVIYDSALNGSPVGFSALTSVKNRYTAEDFKAFIESPAVAGNGIDIILTAEATTGIVVVDDIDLPDYDVVSAGLNLDDPNMAPDVADEDYVGLFDSQSDNGGFEYGAWGLVSDMTDALPETNYSTDVEIKNTGKRSLNINFANGETETITFKMTSYEWDKIVANKDYAFSAFLKTSTDFDGKITLRATKKDDYNTALGGDVTILNGNIYSYFTLTDTSANKFTATDISAFASSIGTDTSFDVYMTVSASKGSVWVDDIDLCTTEALEEKKELDQSGTPVYEGVFENGGFETGAWEVASKQSTHSVSVVETDTYGESLRAVELSSTKALGYDSALKLNGKTVAGKVAELDLTISKAIAIKAKGDFTGSLYVEIKDGANDVLINNSKQIYLINNGSYKNNKWGTLLTSVFTPSGQDITVTLILDGVGSLLIDDVQLVDDYNHGKLLSNGGFENGLTDWGKEGEGTLTIENAVTDDSPSALKLETNGTDKIVKAITVYSEFDQTKDYKLSVSYKTVGVNFGKAIVKVRYGEQNGSGSQWAKWRNKELVISTGGTLDWSTYTAILSAEDSPEWADVIKIYVWLEGNGTLYADNVTLTNDVEPDDFLLKQPEIDGAVYDGNIYNGGFEGGVWDITKHTDQNVTLDSENTYNNSLYSLRVDMTERKASYGSAINFSSSTVSGFASSLDLSKEYRAAVRVRTSDDFRGSVSFQVSQGGVQKWYNYQTELHLIGSNDKADGGYKNWTLLYTPILEKVVNEHEFDLTLVVNGVGTIWFDDADIIVDPDADNLITNGGFESGIWSTWGTDKAELGERVEAVNDDTCGSAKAGKIIANPPAGQEEQVGLYIVSSIKMDMLDTTKNYTLSYDLKYEGVQEEEGVQAAILQWCKIENPDGSFALDENGNFKTNTSWYRYYGAEQLFKMGGPEKPDMDWTHYEMNLSASGWSKNLNSATIFFYLYSPGTVWVDNVKMVEKKVDANVVAGEVSSDTPSGQVRAGTQIQLLTADAMADIWYTVDGTDPVNSKTAYLYKPGVGIYVTHDMTVKAVAKSDDSGVGKVATFTYDCTDALYNEDQPFPISPAAWAQSLDTSTKKVGNNSIKLKGGAGRYWSTGTIPIMSGIDYTVGFWVKTKNMTMETALNASVFVETPVGGGDEVSRVTGSRGADVSDYKETNFTFQKTQDWTYYEMDLHTLRTTHDGIVVTFTFTDTVGEVWVDGLEVRAKPIDYHPMYVDYDNVIDNDGEVLGNHYITNVLSLFKADQGFVIRNQGNTLENGVLHYEMVNDLRPDETLVKGDIEVGLPTGGRRNDKINIATAAQYGTYTISFTMTNDMGNVYDAGEIKFSRAPDNTEFLSNNQLGVCGVVTDVNYLTQQAAIGSSILRSDFDWEKIETSEGVYEVPQDLIDRVNLAKQQGIETMIIFNTHKWPDFMEKKGWPRTDHDIEHFLEYIRFLTDYFKDDVKYYEFINEPDYRHWVDPVNMPDAEEYCDLMAKAYKIVKETDPDSIFIGGVTASTGSSGVNMGWARQVFEYGAAEYMDAYSIHPYVRPRSPETGHWKEDIDGLNDMIVETIGREFPIYITEMGWPNSRSTQGNTYLETMAYSLRAYTMATSMSYMNKVITYCITSGNEIYSSENQYGYQRGTTYLLPLAVGRAAYNYMHNGYKFDSVVEDLASGLYVYKYSGEKDNMYVLWTDDRECYADIVTSDDSAKVYDVYANRQGIDYTGTTFRTDVGGNLTYIKLSKDAKIESVVLTDKDAANEDNNNKDEDKASEDEYEILEWYEYYEDEDDGEQSNNKIKKVKKVIKKVIKGGSDDGFPWLWVIIIGAGVLLLLAAGTVLWIILAKKKKKEKQEPEAV